MSPYREPESAVPDDREDAATDWGMIVFLALFTLASLARVVGAFARGETFGAEPTLALLATVLVGGFLLQLAAGSVWQRARSARVERLPD